MKRRRLRLPAYRRLLSRTLLVLVASGVIGMHTMGHIVPAAARPCPQPAGAGHLPVVAVVALPVVSATCDCADPCMAPSGACLAVLTGLGLLLLIAVLLFAVRQSLDASVPRWRAVVGAVRGPPSAGPMGLVLADLSVLRR